MLGLAFISFLKSRKDVPSSIYPDLVTRTLEEIKLPRKTSLSWLYKTSFNSKQINFILYILLKL